MAIYVPAGGSALFDQSLSLESFNGTNGGVPRNATGIGDCLVARPADFFLSGAGDQIAVDGELDGRQPELKDAVRHSVISAPTCHACPPPFCSPTQ